MPSGLQYLDDYNNNDGAVVTPDSDGWSSQSEDENDLAYATDGHAIDDATGLPAWNSLGEEFERDAAQAGQYTLYVFCMMCCLAVLYYSFHRIIVD
jgi:hypothetical protein